VSNGSQCCALEICCPPAERRLKVPMAIAKAIGCTDAEATRFLDWMDHEGLVFAPVSFQPVIDDLARIARTHPVSGV
jgi:hypothetical protein